MRCAQELREALRESIDALLHACVVCLYGTSWLLGTMGVCSFSCICLGTQRVSVLVLSCLALVPDINSSSIWRSSATQSCLAEPLEGPGSGQVMPGMPAYHARLIDTQTAAALICMFAVKQQAVYVSTIHQLNLDACECNAEPQLI